MDQATIDEVGAARDAAADGATDWGPRFSLSARQAQPSQIQEILKLLDDPSVISLAGGVPAKELFPVAAIATAHAAIFSDVPRAQAALQYTHSEGDPELRDWIAADACSRGVSCSGSNVLITNGGQQSLDLVARLLLDPGDPVYVPFPAYIGALRAFECHRPRFLDLASFSPMALRRSLAYVMPDAANPSGETLDLDRRRNLVAAAEGSGAIILEDSAYRGLSYDEMPLPSLLAIAARASGVEASCVIECGTFSKTVVPGLRVGWIIAPTAVVRQLVLIKQATDLFTSPLTQMALLHILRSLRDDHVLRLRSAYKSRLEAMLGALAEWMPPGVQWTSPRGGMFVWLTLPPEIDTDALAYFALREAKVAFVPGQHFYAANAKRNQMRLNFTQNDEATNREAVRRLADLITRRVA